MAILLLLAIFSVPEVSALTTDNSESSIKVTITDAYYSDLDGGLVTDDIHVQVMFELGDSLFYKYYYSITLILPSGMEYQYLILVYAWVDVVITNNIFYNHATESGDYTVIVEALLVSPGIATDTGIFIFDPPGGSPGGPPTFAVF